MSDEQFTTFMKNMVAGIQKETPKDTGNLADTATRGTPLSHGRYALTVSTRIAPYFHYVNERKKACSRHGESHYHYFDNALDKQLEIIAKKAGGYIERG